MVGIERMTARARTVINLAEQLGMRDGLATVEPEHMLLALSLEGTGVGADALRLMGVETEDITRATPSAFSPLSSYRARPEWSIKVEQVLARAQAESEVMHHNYVGTEHLLMGIVSVEDGTVPIILSRLGLSAKTVRREVCSLLG